MLLVGVGLGSAETVVDVEGEQPAGALKLPWDAERDYAVGEFAKTFGAKVPTRMVASARLCWAMIRGAWVT